MLNLIIATAICSAVPCELPEDFDGTIKQEYTLEQKIEVLQWRTDYLLKKLYETDLLLMEIYQEICAHQDKQTAI